MVLYLMNDDQNSFDYVISILTSILPMCNTLRAEQIAILVDGAGECSVYSGFAPEIYLLYAALQKAGLKVEIREPNKNKKL